MDIIKQNVKKFYHKIFFKGKRLNHIFLIIFFNLIFKLLMFFNMPDLWWDSASYIGIGKYIWTLGEVGFWNPVRPLVLPLILGFFWKIGFSEVVIGRLLQVIFSCLVVYFSYKISFKIFKSEKISLFIAFFIAIDPIIFNNVQHVLTSTMACSFALIGVYSVLKFYEKKNIRWLVLGGAFLSLAFLSRLTFALIVIPVGIYMLFKDDLIKEKFIRVGVISLSFITVLLPYFILNYKLYGNFLYPYIRGIYEIGLAGEAVSYPLMFYLFTLPVLVPMFVFVVIGLYFIFRKISLDKVLLLLLFFIPFIYHMFLVDVKVNRYSIIFLPYLYMISVYGFFRFLNNFKKKKFFVGILVVFLVFSCIISLKEDIRYLRYGNSESQQFLENNYYDHFSGDEFYGKVVLSSNPYPLAYSDVRLYSFFFPNRIFLDEFERNSSFYVMFSLEDNPCDPLLSFCQKQMSEANDAYYYIMDEYEQVLNLSAYGSNHYVYHYDFG